MAKNFNRWVLLQLVRICLVESSEFKISIVFTLLLEILNNNNFYQKCLQPNIKQVWLQMIASSIQMRTWHSNHTFNSDHIHGMSADDNFQTRADPCIIIWGLQPPPNLKKLEFFKNPTPISENYYTFILFSQSFFT